MQNKGGLYSEILREDNFNFNIVSEVKLVVLKLNSKKKQKKKNFHVWYCYCLIGYFSEHSLLEGSFDL